MTEEMQASEADAPVEEAQPEVNEPVADVSATQEQQDATEQQEEPASDDSPDWFMKDKYSSIEEQARSAFELQKKMGKYWGKPSDEYKVEGIEGVDVNDPLIKNLVPALKDMGVSQDGFNHLVNSYLEANNNMMKSMEEELKQTLTQEDAHTYQSIEKWMKDTLTPQEQDIVKNNWLMSAEDFKLFNQLRLMAAPTTNVPSTSSNPVVFESSESVTNEKAKYLKEVKDGLRVKDKNYKDQLDARFRDARARELRAQR